MRLLWCTDIHLDFVRHKKDARVFYDQIVDSKPDAVVVTGDISNGQPARFLRAVADVAKVPVYFVLGNHDFYNSSIEKIRAEVAELCDVSGYKGEIFYLSEPYLNAPVALSDKIALIGVDGWADGRVGSFFKSNVWLTDYQVIWDIAKLGQNRTRVLEKINELGDNEASRAREKLTAAFERGYEQVIFATHVPPWREASWYDGKLSDNHWAPHFVSHAVGRAIVDTVEKFPGRRVLVLCGHCFDDETELLTDNGWYKREELKVGTKVVTWNRETDTFEYNTIQQTHDHNYTGKMLRVRSRGADLLVTPGHGLVDFRRSGGVGLYNADNFFDVTERTFINGRSTTWMGVKLTDDQIRLLVWVAADGSFERNFVRFHFKKQRKIDALCTLLDRMNVWYSKRKQTTGNTKINIKFSADACLDYFSGMYCGGGSFGRVKCLPGILYGVNTAQARVLLDTYEITDGSRVSKNAIQIASSKEFEIDLLQAIFVTNGYRTTKLKRKRDKNTYWILTVNTANDTRVVTANVGEMVDFSGHVWCVTVPNGTLVVRRRGKVCVTQNTHGIGVGNVHPRIVSWTGEANYGHPKVQVVLEVTGDRIATDHPFFGLRVP